MSMLQVSTHWKIEVPFAPRTYQQMSHILQLDQVVDLNMLKQAAPLLMKQGLVNMH
jgi:hypothetical protein